MDTREKLPWVFHESDICDGCISQKLDTGDYSIVGMEELVCIERKRNTAELAKNFTEGRFVDVLKRMVGYRHKIIVCEFNMTDIIQYPVGCGAPDYVIKKMQMTGKFLMKSIVEAQIKYGVNFVFADDAGAANQYVLSVFKRLVELHGQL